MENTRKTICIICAWWHDSGGRCTNTDCPTHTDEYTQFVEWTNNWMPGEPEYTGKRWKRSPMFLLYRCVLSDIGRDSAIARIKKFSGDVALSGDSTLTMIEVFGDVLHRILQEKRDEQLTKEIEQNTKRLEELTASRNN